MKSITLHHLEDDLAREIEQRSKQEGLSLNKYIKAVLRKALDFDEDSIRRSRAHYAQVYDSMTTKEAEEFYQSTVDLSDVDLSQWYRF